MNSIKLKINDVILQLINVWVLILMLSSPSFAQTPQEVAERTRLLTKLGERVEGGITLTDEEGKEFQLAELFEAGKPVVVIPVYYGCPRLCGLTLTAASRWISQVTLQPGVDYQIVTVSFDKSEGADDARRAGGKYRKLAKLGAEASRGWRFSVAEEESIERLMGQLGYQYLETGGEFAHTSAFFVLTPGREISQFFTGVEFSAWSVKMALVEASEGKIGELLDHVLLFCFKFDPLKGRYTWAAWNFVRIGSVLCMLLFFGAVYYFGIRKRY